MATKLTDSLKATLAALATYLDNPAASRSSRNHTRYAWWQAATAAGLAPDNFHLRPNWKRTTAALEKRGLVEWVAFDWELNGQPRRGWGLRLTEAGRAYMAALSPRPGR